MTGSELSAIRKQLGLTTIQWGRLIGYIGTDESVAASVRRLEGKHDKPIPSKTARLAWINRFGEPDWDKLTATRKRKILPKPIEKPAQANEQD